MDQLDRQNKKQGFVMIEILVGILIVAVILVAFTRGLFYATLLNQVNRDQLRAQLYLDEAVEAMRSLEETDWTQVASATCTAAAPCSIRAIGGNWLIVSGVEVLDTLFTRSVVFDSVYRDSATYPNTIVSSGGVVDPDTLHMTVYVEWDSIRGNRTMSAESYLYNL